MLAMEIHNKIIEQVSDKIIGKAFETRLLTIALLAQGHAIIEGVPGIAKTLLAKSFANILELEFKRVQLTSDMLPSDITGTFVFNVKEQEFFFRKGPLFSNIVLADEINRGIPKTQSALLEAMQEYQVTVEGQTEKLSQPFMVIATQNPLEMRGTYPLPEAQLDRFMFRITMGLPDKTEELEVLNTYEKNSEGDLEFSTINTDIVAARDEIKSKITISKEIKEYIISIMNETRRETEEINLGASPRASLHLMRACKVNAALDGRDYVTPDDVKLLLFPVLNHRLIINPDYLLRNTKPSEVFNYSAIKEIIDKAAYSVNPPR
jgi:MoxR-like ATPase